MSTKVIAGRKPLSSKPKRTAIVDEPDFFTNRLSLSSALREEIEGQGLEYRWIDYAQYVQNGNQHNRGWTVYKSKAQTADAFALGANPDGIIRRGSTVLAVRRKEYGDKHREYLASKNLQYKGFKESKADELRRMAREASVDSVIDDTFDDDDEADEQ